MATRSDKPSTVPILGGLGLLTLAGVALALGYWRMFSHFPAYDDEGYIMLTVRDYLAGGGLYGRVYSQYGPGFYVLMDLLAGWFGLAVTHAGARWFSLALWFGAAVGCGELVRYLSRSTGWAVGAGVATFLFLYQFSEEAFHPGVVVVFVLPWAVRGLVARTGAGAGCALAVIAGVTAAFLTLLKINVGLLFGTALVVWYLLMGRSQWPGGRWGGAMGLGAVAVFTLLGGAMGEGWVMIFALVTLVGIAGVVAVTTGTRAMDWREVVWGGLGGVVSAVFVVGVVILGGTSFSALLEGMLWGPLRHADSYSYAVDWRPGTWVNAGVAVAVLVVYLRWSRGGRGERAERLLVAARGVLLVGTGVAVVGLDLWRVFGAMFSFIAPWIWVWIPVPGASERDGTTREAARPLVGLVLLFQMLHAYPVGGIQICWGSFLWLSLCALGGPETLQWLRARSGAMRRVAQAVGLGLVMMVGGKLLVMAGDHRQAHHALTPVNLTGSGALRLPAAQTAVMRTLTVNSILHGDVLFSMPGMFSFNLWSEVPTPNQFNTTLWYRLLDDASQAAIIADLEAAPNPVIIQHWLSLHLEAAQGRAAAGPLHDYIVAEFQTAFRVNEYAFMVRKDRAIAPFGTAWAAPDSGRVQVCLLGGESGITAIQPLDAAGNPAGFPPLTAENSRVTVQPVDRAGRPRGNPITAWPLRWPGLAWVTIEDVGGPADWSLIAFSHADGSAPTVAVRAGR